MVVVKKLVESGNFENLKMAFKILRDKDIDVLKYFNDEQDNTKHPSFSDYCPDALRSHWLLRTQPSSR